MEHRLRKPGLLLAALLALVVGLVPGCRGEEPEEAPAPEPERAPEPPPDTTPPTFAGVQEVEQVAENSWRLRWRAADDDRSDASNIVYEVLHVSEPWRSVTEESEVVHTTGPGQVMGEVELTGRVGRVAVRAVDEAGNRSAVDSGLRVPARRSWMHAVEGTLATPLAHCERWDSGRALCAAVDGTMLQWDRNRWRMLDQRGSGRMHATRAADRVLFWSEEGAMVVLEPDGTLREVAPEFLRGVPALPLRQVSGDALGTTTVIDAEGAVWMGVAPRFMKVERPLFLPRGERCSRLAGVVHAGMNGRAFCDDGAIWSVAWDRARAQWLPLMAEIPSERTEALRTAVQLDERRMLVLAGRNAHLLGAAEGEDMAPLLDLEEGDWVGGWRRTDGGVQLATSRGLLQIAASGAPTPRLVPGGQGRLVGLLGPTALEPDDQLTVFHADGAVGALRRGRTDWKAPPPLGEPMALGRDAEGVVLVVAGRPEAAVYALDDAEGAWRRLAALPREVEVDIRGVVAGANGRLVLVGEREGSGWIRTLDGRAWRSPVLQVAQTLVDALEPAPDDGSTDEATESPLAAPLAPLRTTTLAAAGEAFGFSPLRGVDTDLTGERFIAWGERQVWGSRDGVTWALWHVAAEPLVHAFPDGGHAWVGVTASGVFRCIREHCENVPQLSGGPSGLVSASVEGTDGLLLEGTGALWRFQSGLAPDEGTAPQDQLPGRIQRIADAMRAPPERPIARRIDADRDVALGADGGLMVADDGGRWRVAIRAEGSRDLLRLPSAIAVVATDGVLVPGDAVPVRRSDEGGAR